MRGVRQPVYLDDSQGPPVLLPLLDVSPVTGLVVGDVVVRPNGKRASVWKVSGSAVTVVWSAARSNMQQTFRASDLGRVIP